jgi:tetratricopeptide (TPR) repeat protein
MTKAPVQKGNKKLSFNLTPMDIIAGSFWFVLLFLVFPLPNNGTPFAFKAGGFLVWSALTALYTTFKIASGKKNLYFSLLKNNFILLALSAVIILSTILSVSTFESLWGTDLSFISSSVVLLAGIFTIFIIKTLNTSLETDITVFIKQLPFWFVLSSIVSLIIFLLPVSFYSGVFGAYSEYLGIVKEYAFVLHGNGFNTFVFGLIAGLVAIWNLLDSGTKDSVKTNTSMITNSILLVLTALFTAHAAPLEREIVVIYSLAGVVFAGTWILIGMKEKGTALRFGFASFGFIAAIALLKFIYFSLKINGPAYAILPFDISLNIIRGSFVNTLTPLWRFITGWGVSSFGYLFSLYRPLNVVQAVGSDVIFFKPFNFWMDVFAEQGILGFSIWVAMLSNAIYTFYKSENKQELYLEFALVLLFIVLSFISFFSTPLLIVLFVVFGIYFAKYELQQENLSKIRVVNLTSVDYKGRTSTLLPRLLIVVSVVLTITALYVTIQGMNIYVYMLKVFKRSGVAQTYVSQNKPKEAAEAFVSTYNMAVVGESACESCSVFSYMKLNSLYSVYLLSYSSADQLKDLNLDKRFLANRVINHAYNLVERNPVKSDYWYLTANVFASVAEIEKSQAYADEALLSYSAALSQNPLNINARYSYLDFLTKLGEDQQSLQLTAENLNILKQIVGSPIRVAFIEASYNVRLKQYDNALKIYEDIKKALDTLNISQKEKDDLRKFTDEQISAAKKLKEKPPVTPTPTASVTPSASPTTTATPTPSQ